MKLSKLAGISKGKKYTINGVELELKSIPLDEDSSVLMEGSKDTSVIKQMDTMKVLVRKMLKESVPDATEPELDDCMRMQSLMPLMDAFYEVNGMKDAKSQSDLVKIKDAIKSRQVKSNTV